MTGREVGIRQGKGERRGEESSDRTHQGRNESLLPTRGGGQCCRTDGGTGTQGKTEDERERALRQTPPEPSFTVIPIPQVGLPYSPPDGG